MHALLGLAAVLLSSSALAGTEYVDTVYWTDGTDFPGFMDDATELGIYAQTWNSYPWTGFDGPDSAAWLSAWDCDFGVAADFPLAFPMDYFGQVGENDEFFTIIRSSDISIPVPSGRLCIEAAGWNGFEVAGDPGTANWGYFFDEVIILDLACADTDGNDICDAAVPPCLDSDGDEVCDEDDVCPDFDDRVDSDRDGTPDGCDVCPLGDSAGLEFWTFQYLIDAADPYSEPFPAELQTGVTYDAYGQFYHEFTFAEGAQTAAQLGIGTCGDPASYGTWLDAVFYADIFNNDEWLASFELPEEFTGGEFCMAWRGRSDGGGDACWVYTEEHVFTGVGAEEPAVGLTTEGACPGVVTIEIAGGVGASYVIAAGDGFGSTTIPAGACAGTELGVESAGPLTKFGPLTDADGDGIVSMRPSLPLGVCGKHLQAINIATCEVSEVVTF